MKSAKKSKLFLISLVRTSESRVALFTQRFLISFKISFFSMNQKLNFELVQLFLIGIIPEQFLHLMMALITGSFIF